MASTGAVGGSPTLKNRNRIPRRAGGPMAVGVCLPRVGTLAALPQGPACRTKRRVTREKTSRHAPKKRKKTHYRSRALSISAVGAAIALCGVQADHGASLTRARLAYEWTDSQSQLAQQNGRPLRWWSRQQPAPRRREEVTPLADSPSPLRGALLCLPRSTGIALPQRMATRRPARKGPTLRAPHHDTWSLRRGADRQCAHTGAGAGH